VIVVSKKAKLEEAIKNNPKDISFDELHRYLVANGATWREGRKGSHRVYILNGEQLTVPRRKPLNAVYPKKAIKLVEAGE